jgi:Rrf2 family protein
MQFSKTFGYALRGILYVSLMNDEKRNVRIEEIAENLSIPRHFLAKIMKLLVKEGILSSSKGPNGGFFVNNATLSTNLITLLTITDGKDQFVNCVLHFRHCNEGNPCPLHEQVKEYRKCFHDLLADVTIENLVSGKKPEIIRSLIAV